MMELLWLPGLWAIGQVARALPRIIWAIRCPPNSMRYVCPPADAGAEIAAGLPKDTSRGERQSNDGMG